MPFEKDVAELVPTAVLVIIFVVVLGVGSLVLGQMQGLDVNFENQVTTDEYDQPTATNGINSTSGFQQYTLDNKGPEDLVAVSTVKFSDVSGGTNTTLTEGDNYTVDLTAASNQVNVTKVDAYDSSSGDAFFTTYTNSTRQDSWTIVSNGVGGLQTFADFLTVIIIITIAGVIFMLLSVVRRVGSNSSV